MALRYRTINSYIASLSISLLCNNNKWLHKIRIQRVFSFPLWFLFWAILSQQFSCNAKILIHFHSKMFSLPCKYVLHIMQYKLTQGIYIIKHIHFAVPPSRQWILFEALKCLARAQIHSCHLGAERKFCHQTSSEHIHMQVRAKRVLKM